MSAAPERKRFGPEPLPWHPLPHMDEWLDELRASEISEGYIASAKSGVARFATFLVSQGIMHPGEIERPHILRYQAYLTSLVKADGKPFSLQYRKQLLKYARAWINWLEKNEYIDINPWRNIRVGKVDKKPKPLEDDEIALLFDTHKQQAFSITPFYYHRREAILVLLYGWGLRLHELQSLDVTSMDMRLDYVTVRNKSRAGSSNDSKVLPYGQAMKDVIGRWLRVRAMRAAVGEGSLLIDNQGGALSIHGIRRIVTELGRRAGVDINPHRLRDSFGTTMLDNDVPVEQIMKMMGHTQRAQTLAYARVNDHKIKESHDLVVNPLLNKLLGGLPDDDDRD